jgi:hypothetical protein
VSSRAIESLSAGVDFVRATVYTHTPQIVLLGDRYSPPSDPGTYEIYNDTPVLLKTGMLADPLANHTATPLADGNLFVAGGAFDTTLWQIFSLFTGQIQVLSTGSLQDSRDYAVAALLGNGNVFLGGGAISAGTWEIHSPTGALVSSGDLTDDRTAGASPIVLKNGNIWISGSAITNPDACTWEILDVNGNPVSSGSLNTCFAGGKVEILANGNVILLGGDNAPGAYEIYTETGTRVVTGSLINGFNHGATAVSLDGGSQVFIFGSCTSGSEPGDPYHVPSCSTFGAIGTWELLGFDSNSNKTSDTTGSLADSRGGARAVVTSTGNIFISGGDFAPESWEMWTPSGTTVTLHSQGELNGTRYGGHTSSRF